MGRGRIPFHGRNITKVYIRFTGCDQTKLQGTSHGFESSLGQLVSQCFHEWSGMIPTGNDIDCGRIEFPNLKNLMLWMFPI
jgi:hypothetical protein